MLDPKLTPLRNLYIQIANRKIGKRKNVKRPNIMRTPFLLIAVLVAGQAYADLIPISAFRSLGISGNVVGSSYSQTVASDVFGTFDRTLSDALTVQSPIPPDPVYGGASTQIHLDSLASQTSTITQDDIAISAFIAANLGVYMDLAHPPISRRAQANFNFEYTFSVIEPLTYELTGTFSRGTAHAPSLPDLNIFLSSTDLFMDTALRFGPLSRSGILLPDTYTLRLDSSVSTNGDPLGDFQNVQLNLNFRTAAVPEMGSTLMLLAIAFAALIVALRMSNGNIGSWCAGGAKLNPSLKRPALRI